MKAKTLYKLILRRDPPARMGMDYGVFFLIWKFVRKFINASIAPFVPFNSVRVFLYRRVGYTIGKNCFIGMHCYLDDRYPEMITIGNNVDVSYCTKFATHGLGHGGTPIVIKDYAYIGMGSMLISGREGITIGEGTIIGAGSVVTRSVADWKIAVGNPARVIRDAPRGTPDDPHPRHLFAKSPTEASSIAPQSDAVHDDQKGNGP